MNDVWTRLNAEEQRLRCIPADEFFLPPGLDCREEIDLSEPTLAEILGLDG